MFYSREQDECPVCGKMKSASLTTCSVECSSLIRRKTERPSKEELEKDINENSLTEVGKKYKVSDNTIRAWLYRYGLKPNTRRESRLIVIAKEKEIPKPIKENKLCPRCTKEKKISEFYSNKREADGKACWCKECTEEYKKKHREQKATLVATTKGKEMRKKGMVMKQKIEVNFNSEQQELISILKNPKTRDSRGRLILSNKTKKQLSDFIHFLKENNYRVKDVTELTSLSAALIQSHTINKQSKKTISSPEVSLQKESIRRVEILTAKKEPAMSLFTVDLENKSLIFSSRSEMFTFMNRIAGDE